MKYKDEVKLHVSPKGCDGWSGLVDAPNVAGTDGPLATVEAARDRIRAIRRAGGLSGPAEVLLHVGLYQFDKTLRFTAADLGDKNSPVVYRSAGDGEVIFTGGRVLTGFEPTEKGMLHLNLISAGLSEMQINRLQFNGHALRKSRYPKYDEADPYGKGWLYVDGNAVDAGEPGHGHKDRFICSDPRLKQWHNLKEIEVFIFPRFNWTNDIVKIVDYDPETGEVRLQRPAIYEIYPCDRFYFRNVQEELSQPGEWYHDQSRGCLFIISPHAYHPGKDVITVATVDHILEITGPREPAENLNTEKIDWLDSGGKIWSIENPQIRAKTGHLQFDGITFDGCNGAAVVMKNVDGCYLTGCTIRNAGGCGAVVLGGEKCVVADCDIYETGSHGVYISGGLRSPFCNQYVSCGHHVENNYIHHIGTEFKSVAGVAVNGVGIRAAHNYIHDSPRWGILSRGNDNLIEYNHIRHVNTETCDTSGIYLVDRDLSMHGTVIRYNRIHDILGYRCVYGQYVMRDFSFGIYLDDWTSGVIIYGNLIYRTPWAGVFIHGGQDNIVANNILVDMRDELAFFENCSSRSEYEMLGTHAMGLKRNVFQCNILASSLEHTSIYRISATENVFVHTSITRNKWQYNLIWRGGKCPDVRIQNKGKSEYVRFQEWASAHEQGSLVADPRFVSPENDDYTLKEDSPAFSLGFQALPVAEMGLYYTDKRSSWPVQEAKGIREILDRS